MQKRHAQETERRSKRARAVGTTVGIDEMVPSADRQKVSKLFQSSLQGSQQTSSVADALEQALCTAACSIADYRGRARGLIAALRRSEGVRLQLLQGKLAPQQLVDGGEEFFLTDEQRRQREAVRRQSLESCLGTNLGGLGYYVMGIDCNGSDCHVECDRRHLEPREQQRGSWSSLADSHLVLCAGPERSGSTWLYNAIRLLHLEAKVPCDSYWLARLTEAKLQERLAAQPPAVVLVKTHEWFPDYDTFIHRAKHVVLTHRDLRGVIASYRRVKWEVAIPDAYVHEHMEWQRRCTLDLAYEDIMRRGSEVLKRLAEHLGLTVPEAGVRAVHAELKDLTRRHSRNVMCQVTKLWPDHRSLEAERLQGRADAPMHELNALRDPEYADVLNSRFKEFQELYGYI
eukprot:TRINITY_DN108129_c0_g1_i1.p1 TRINITY_DN108129_c0_g1~~TRINITY_DN108129_c0_g1_i1.p1  ORF type:complete len:401 (-),score=79.31 TRINITY_DN108129_c0_g1_i1:177-1379(-)